MNQRRILVEHEGKLYVQDDSTLSSSPRAIRRWWPVHHLEWSPWAVVGPAPLGEPLRMLPTTNGPSFEVGQCSVYLPDGGRTEECARWEAIVPPPAKHPVVQDKYWTKRGDAIWLNGAWTVRKALSDRTIDVKWDKLEWKKR